MTLQKQQSAVAQKKTKILIVDDHPIVRKGLENLLNQEEDFIVCGQAEDASQAMKAIKTLNPDMVIVDISLKGKNGLELTKDISVQYPHIPVLVLSMHDESLYAERVLRAGAKGYIMKQQGTEKLILAIRKILSGQEYVSDKVVMKMIRKLVGRKPQINSCSAELLSDRELEVFLLIGHGFGTRQIASQLYLSVKTIETYRAHIKEKLNLADSSELLQYAIQWVNS